MSAPPPPPAGSGQRPEPPSPAESPRLERHQVRVGSVEPVSPSLARRPDGSLLRLERSPTPNENGSLGRTPSPRESHASERVSVTSFEGVPRWAHIAEPYNAPGGRAAAGAAVGDPQSKRSSQFDMHIHELRDQQERMQTKTFLNWINSYLRMHEPPMQISNLMEDLTDSTRLLALLSVLSGQQLPVERGRVLRRPHFLSNANTALRFLQSRQIKLVNINPSDIVDGKPPVILGLIWTIILHFQIEMSTHALDQLSISGMSSRESSVEPTSVSTTSSGVTTPTAAEPPQGAAAAQEKPVAPPRAAPRAAAPGARKALLTWTKAATKRYGVEVSDFGPSWRDGRAFVAVVHCIEPRAIDVSATERMDTHQRLDTAFKAAEEDLGVARLLDPEDVDVPNPDEKSVMTYVAQFLHKHPKPKMLQPASGKPTTPEEEVLEISVWVIKTTRVIRTLKPDDRKKFEKFQTTRTEATERHLRYTRLKQVLPGSTAVTTETWHRIDQDWVLLETELSTWQRELDASLPTPLSGVAQWVDQAETQLLKARSDPPVTSRRSSELVTVILEEHTVLKPLTATPAS